MPTHPVFPPDFLSFQYFMKAFGNAIARQKAETLLGRMSSAEISKLTPEYRLMLSRIPAITSKMINPTDAAEFTTLPGIPGFVGVSPTISSETVKLTALHEGAHAWDATTGGSLSRSFITPPAIREKLYETYYGGPPKYTMENHMPSDEQFATAASLGPKNLPLKLRKSLFGMFKTEGTFIPKKVKRE